MTARIARLSGGMPEVFSRCRPIFHPFMTLKAPPAGLYFQGTDFANEIPCRLELTGVNSCPITTKIERRKK